MSPRALPFALVFGLCAAGCFSFQNHAAPVRTFALPPPPDPVVHHSQRLWIALEPGTGASQCVTPDGNRPVCFENVDSAIGNSLGGALWTSFPGVSVLSRGDSPAPGDYVLKLELWLNPVPPSAGGPGWAVSAKGRWQLERDRQPLARESVESVSRADFGYGAALGYGAGEVVDAIAVHIGTVLGALPEARPPMPRPLPPVVAEADALDTRPTLASAER